MAPDEKAYATSKDKRTVDRDTVQPTVDTATPQIRKLERAVETCFADENLTEEQRNRLEKDFEDVLLGRLELEQPLISAEAISRIMMRCLSRLGEWAASGIVGNAAQTVLTTLATAFVILK